MPKTPDEAAEFLVERFGQYLPEREQHELRRLVAELMQEWGDLVGGVTAESGPR